MELVPNRDAALDDLIASVEPKRLKNALLEHLTKHELRELCKRLA
ncbi:low affinity iron permease family protein [Tumebacillus permanentifrigoris]|nr:low affinity iron permease family protein [Tumebacillus permanentifrigoris]